MKEQRTIVASQHRRDVKMNFHVARPIDSDRAMIPDMNTAPLYRFYPEAVMTPLLNPY
jgi:hypothetical protein